MTSDDPERGGKLAAFVLHMVDQTELVYSSISNYVWGLCTWMGLQRQLESVQGVRRFTEAENRSSAEDAVRAQASALGISADELLRQQHEAMAAIHVQSQAMGGASGCKDSSQHGDFGPHWCAANE